jgi:O-acetyl-ADP-ribose deacetylase (regulator of RNase III)
MGGILKMVSNKDGSIFDAEVTHIIHQANLYHTFGSGIAAEIKKRFPEAYEADKLTIRGDKKRLGTFTFAKSKGIIIVNLYSQDGMGGTERHTDYVAMLAGLERIREWIPTTHKKPNVGLPFKIGCGLANGDWKIVKPIIDGTFSNVSYPVTIYKP